MSNPELLEIVELTDGQVVLRRADSSAGTGEPLVSIRFSAEAREFLGEHAGALGKSMIAAGLQMLGAIFSRQGDEPGEGGSERDDIVSPEDPAEGDGRPAKTRLH